MSEHQPAIEGALNSAQEHKDTNKELIQSDSEKKKVDPQLLKEVKESNDTKDNQHCAEPKNPEKNEASGEDINRPLVLEERHSLSIAETKKRRASIYSNELLFIPKELARSELHQRTRTLSRYAKNREYHLRMLKFPVGSGRPRIVAEQMKKAQAIDQSNSEQALDGSELSEGNVAIKREEEPTDEVHGELQDSSGLPQNMHNFQVEKGLKNQLPDEQEISNILFDLVKKEVVEKEALEERNRKILQSQRQSVIITNTSRLQHYPYLRWHKPDRKILDFNSLLQFPCKVEKEPEVPVNYSEIPLMNVSSDCNQTEEESVVRIQEQEQNPQLPDNQEDPLQSQFQNPETIIYLPQCENELQPQLVAAEVPVDNSTRAAPMSLDPEGQSTNSALRQQLIHHIVQPATLRENLLQSSSCNNNADDRINQNLRQPQFLETFPPEIDHQWNPASVENYADQAYHEQQLHLQQQYLYTQQQQHQQHQLMVYHQHQYNIENQIQEMRIMYQRIKCREEEQLHHYGKSLKKIQEERLACERRHAEEKRVFLFKIEQSRKLEEKLRSEKEQLLRHLRTDLKTLELRIADQQRQQKEKALAWSWQHQQQHQQSQYQQPHFQEMEAPPGQYIQTEVQPSQDQYTQHQQMVNQQHTLLYHPPAYVYSPAYQDMNVHQHAMQPYHEQMPPNPAETHAGMVRSALEMPHRVLQPPPPFCPTSTKTLDESSLSSRKIRHRRLTTDHRSEPYAVPVRDPPPPSAPPPAEYLQFPGNPHIGPGGQSSHDLEIRSVMANYAANYMNRRA
nr:trichohyalin [Drosophila kikkawai]